MSGLVLWEGPSRINKEKIIVVGILHSENVKTGNMIQTVIMPQNVSPLTAINNGYDACVCGDCELRGKLISSYRGNYLGIHHKTTKNYGRICYVRIDSWINQSWVKYQAGKYPLYNHYKHSHLFRNRKIRLGSYGDVTAVPLSIWKRYLKLCSGHTGYTRQWKNKHNQSYSKYLQASVFTTEEAQLAQQLGWKTFRIKTANAKLQPNEKSCVASVNSKIQCLSCMVCQGSKSNIVINVHGTGGKINSFTKLLVD